MEEKKPSRKEALETKKSKDALIKAASSAKDPLAAFSSLLRYDSGGLSVCFQSGRGSQLSSSMKRYVQDLIKLNMEEHFGQEWPTEEKVKRREMAAPGACYIFAYEQTRGEDDVENRFPVTGSNGVLVGFVHYRFVFEEELPVLYVYELQLDRRVQGKGLGKFLMQLLELIAKKYYMAAIMLTVQKANALALSFYQRKLGYVISATSPSRIHPSTGDMSYEILCKALNCDATLKLL